jgi:hypothetical protein
MKSRRKYHNVVVEEDGNKVHIACHHLAFDLGNYRFPFILAIKIDPWRFSLSLHSSYA